MLHQLPVLPTPQWLQELSAKRMLKDPFPLQEVLTDSLYYPSSGFDGDPVKYLTGNVYSFIYVDYGKDYRELEESVQTPGFKGYELIASRSITQSELTPNGWTPVPPIASDGDPHKHRDWIKEPFCSWRVFQRSAGVPELHGPPRFSLLFLCADGVTAFQALYLSNSAAPRAVAIIQPGHGFGRNWTNFEDQEQVFARTVLGNPYGRPQILLYGGYGPRKFYQESCWKEFSTLVCHLAKGGQGTIGVWV